MDNKDKKCETCKFFAQNLDGETGQCRKNPPTAIQSAEWGAWPKVENGDWCGEHKPAQK